MTLRRSRSPFGRAVSVLSAQEAVAAPVLVNGSERVRR